jgi:A-macroglobulin TED domain
MADLSSVRNETPAVRLSLVIQWGSKTPFLGPCGFFMGANVTDQQSEPDSQIMKSAERVGSNRGTADAYMPQSASSDAIAAGLEFLFSRRRQKSWSMFAPAIQESASWVTAYVLTRLGEISAEYISYSQRQQIEESLDWLTEARTTEGGWGFGATGSPDDADSTAWAVTALRQHGRAVPNEALELIRRSRGSDGGFAVNPSAATSQNPLATSAPDVTAIAARALDSINTAASEFLASHLRTDVPGTPCRLASRFFVSSTLLDWEPGMAPWFVVNTVRRMTTQYSAESAWEQALLLRCLMRLRMQSGWALLADLRRMQQPDGSWPGSVLLAPLSSLSAHQPEAYVDEQGILATATALSALAMGDLQPGLYFGSDLPFRRL